MKDKQFRAAKVRANSFDKESNTISIVWTTGAAVRRYDPYDGEYDEVLSLEPGAVRLDRLNSGAPLLDTHDSTGLNSVVGEIVEGSAKIEDGRGIASVVLSKAKGVEDTVQKIREGVAKGISVGYWLHKIEKSEGEDGVARWDVVDWEPLEVSIVAVPADAESQVRSAGRARPRDRQTPAARAAAYARSLLRQSSQTSAEAKGAKEARKALGTIGRMSPVSNASKMEGRTTEFHPLDFEAGAREARALLKGRRA